METGVGEASRMNFEEWQKKQGLADNDVLSKDFRFRRNIPPEIIQCACGCGEWRTRLDKSGKERRYIRGHSARGRKLSAEQIRKMREGRYKNREVREKQKEITRLKKTYGKFYKYLERVFDVFRKEEA